MSTVGDTSAQGKISGELPDSLPCCGARTCCVAPCVSPVCADVCPASSRQAEFWRPLNPFLYPTDQLRGPPVLPEHSVSLEELQGQLAQAARLHQEETERFTDRIRKVNMSRDFSTTRCLMARPLEADDWMYLKESCRAQAPGLPGLEFHPLSCPSDMS